MNVCLAATARSTPASHPEYLLTVLVPSSNQTLVHNSSHFLFQFYSLRSTIACTTYKQWSKILFKNLRVTQPRSCPPSAEPGCLIPCFLVPIMIHSKPIHPVSLIFVLILSSHLRVFSMVISHQVFWLIINKAGAISSDCPTSCSVLQFRMRYSNGMTVERAEILAETFVVCLKEMSAWLVAVWHSKLLNLPSGSFTAEPVL